MSYQKIDINGFYYDGIDRTEDYKRIFSEKPKGLTILDIGCNNGFYSLKAVSDGANYALGIDNHDKFLEIGKRASRFLGYNVDFLLLDVLKDKLPNKEFDIVLCLNLVHHFSSIDQVNYLFDELYKRCKKEMVFEVLKCEDIWDIIENDKGNKKIHIGLKYFENKFSENIISFDSKVTKNRMIIKVLKSI